MYLYRLTFQGYDAQNPVLTWSRCLVVAAQSKFLLDYFIEIYKLDKQLIGRKFLGRCPSGEEKSHGANIVISEFVGEVDCTVHGDVDFEALTKPYDVEAHRKVKERSQNDEDAEDKEDTTPIDGQQAFQLVQAEEHKRRLEESEAQARRSLNELRIFKGKAGEIVSELDKSHRDLNEKAEALCDELLYYCNKIKHDSAAYQKIVEEADKKIHALVRRECELQAENYVNPIRKELLDLLRKDNPRKYVKDKQEVCDCEEDDSSYATTRVASADVNAPETDEMTVRTTFVHYDFEYVVEAMRVYTELIQQDVDRRDPRVHPDSLKDAQRILRYLEHHTSEDV